MIGTTSHGLETSMMHQEVGCIMKLTAGCTRRTQVQGTFGSMMPSWDGSGQDPHTTTSLQPLKLSIYIPQHMQVGSTSQPATASESFTCIPIPTPSG